MTESCLLPVRRSPPNWDTKMLIMLRFVFNHRSQSTNLATTIRSKRAIALLEGEVHALKEALQYAAPLPDTRSVEQPEGRATTNDQVFVVHGRGTAAKNEVARLIERAGLQAGAERTITFLGPHGASTRRRIRLRAHNAQTFR